MYPFKGPYQGLEFLRPSIVGPDLLGCWKEIIHVRDVFRMCESGLIGTLLAEDDVEGGH